MDGFTSRYRTNPFVWHLVRTILPNPANIVYLKDFQEEQAKFVFLHKDYLGSVLAITNEEGYAIEQRHFNAWD